MITIIDVVPHAITIGPDIVDSYWVGIHPANHIAAELSVDRVARILDAIRMLDRTTSVPASVLEKALLHRDLLQICYVLARLRDMANQDQSISQARHAESAFYAVVPVLRRFLLSEEELLDLRHEMRARYLFAGVSARPATLEPDYLPSSPLCQKEGDGWYLMNFSSSDNKHFAHYEGRSFIHVWFRAPNLTRREFYDYWDDIAATYGKRVNLSAKVPELPDGCETALVRTFAVVLDNGEIADSGIPEEVILRLFSHNKARVDAGTSDYKGTMHYQYKMKRKLLLGGKRVYGLSRIREEEASFVGFHTEVPDKRNSYRECITTMRYNCLVCHSETFYGASSVFSLGKTRVQDGKERFEGSDILRPIPSEGRFIGVSSFYRSLIDTLSQSR
jgi:hypothetical protein